MDQEILSSPRPYNPPAWVLTFPSTDPLSVYGRRAYAASLLVTLSRSQVLAASISSSPSSCPPRCQNIETSAPPLCSIAELAEFIDVAAEHYGFSKRHLVAVGYSNGANIAASLILLHPHYLKAAVLFRAMVPFAPDIVRNFTGLSVFLAGGKRDSIVQHDQTEQLAALR